MRGAEERPSRSVGNVGVEGATDPTKVTRSVLQNAPSGVALMLTDEAMVADFPEKQSAPPMPGGYGSPDLTVAGFCFT